MSEIKFRKEAQKAQFSSEELTGFMRVTTLKHWVMLWVVYGFLAVLVGFGLFGRIPTRVTGQGLLLSTKGVLQDVIMPSGSGRVNAMHVAVGSIIHPGDVVASLDNQDVSNKIVTATAYYEDLKKQYDELKLEALEETAERDVIFKSQQAMNQVALATEQTHLTQVSDLLKRKEDMAARGLVNKEQLMSSYNDYYAVKSKIDQLQSTLIQDKLDNDRFRLDYQTKLRDLNVSVAQAQRDLSDLISQKKSVTTIKSTISGVVTHMHVSIGDVIKEGQPLLSVASLGQGLDAIFFVPAQQGQRIKPGAEVLISPMNIKRAEYGSMIASATEVTRFPSSPESMLAMLHNQELVDQFTKEGAVMMIRAAIMPDHNLSGYRWTTGQGPDLAMTPGMLVTAYVTVKTQAPITLIIPFLRHVFYGDEL